MITRERIVSGALWKFFERCGNQLVSFIVQIILARILAPQIYGTLAIIVVFITLTGVVNQTGLNTALIQRKDTTEDDYSTVFYICLCLSGFLYLLLFFTAPVIEAYYKITGLSLPLRILALKLLTGAFNSIQIAKVTKEMQFRKIFFSSLGGVTVSGMAGIILAYKGFGLWALVIQQLLCDCVICLVMWFTVSWRPKRVFSAARARIMFSFGWKLLASQFLDTLYQNLRSLVIGKKFDSGTLAYYDRGKQFPNLIINNIQQTVNCVMLPALSAEQDDIARLKATTRKVMSASTYIIFPMMAGIAAVAKPLVRLLLTEKWMACVPFIKISCLVFAFYPIFIINLQAINALGRSDIYLTLEIIKKFLGICVLAIAVLFFHSALAIAVSETVFIPIGLFLNAFPSRKLFGYGYLEQTKDMLPAFTLSAVMYGLVLLITRLGFSDILTMAFQVVAGTLIYIGGSWLLKIDIFVYLLKLVKESFIAGNKT